MGHDNLSNLSKLFVNLLYAKGSITIEQAIKTAIDRGEVLHASEGCYDDEHMLGYSFECIVHLLNSSDGNGYAHEHNWEGPWIVPCWDLPKSIDKLPMRDALKEVIKTIKNRDVYANYHLYRTVSDMLKQEGYPLVAIQVMDIPRNLYLYNLWKNNPEKFEQLEAWDQFDKIRWIFAHGWRKRYKEVPILSNVTN